ncbi:monosaccharide ABC transporter substrate-binding protein, CUT2 family [Carboxydocella sporoproducens DSM 16521]|uniref:Monosaccharide ABC transporter substrate-binding protein, CUT2 family n=2 Tax=Carboxydocella TaxID=178898 RepID=A0A1T4Q006_9FIRM|nr:MULTISPECIES: substrate-binding domain-containing protein [Carboxydocella]AVX21248.1 ABC-type sugar transport system, substrate-binding protein [Carboxydocella thermautotrophica]SJZ96877.1 monosaccharide ABC transporter substrate-binding protein, CUT2 family [Carboxydocella sporoproducens DSM 16521]
MGRRIVAFSLVLLVVLTGGCGLLKKAKKPLSKKENEIPIGVAMANMAGDGYPFFKKEMDKGAKPAKVKLLWQDAKNDGPTQAVQVEKLLEKKIKALVLLPADAAIARDIVSKTAQKKVKVLILENLPRDVNADGFLSPDWLRAGELQGELLVKQKFKGNLLVLTAAQPSMVEEALFAGLQRSLQGLTGIKVKQAPLDVTGKPEDVATRAYEALKSQTGIQGIVVQHSLLVPGLIKYLKEKKEKQETLPVTVALGASKEGAAAIAGDLLTADVDTRPDLLAYYALAGASKLAKKEMLEYDQKIKNDGADVPVKVIPVRLIRKDNLYLLEERWGKIKPLAVKSGSGSQGDSKSGESEKKGQSAGESTPSKIKIKGKEGKTLELELKPGESLELEIDGEIKAMKRGKGEEQEGQQGGTESGQGT